MNFHRCFVLVRNSGVLQPESAPRQIEVLPGEPDACVGPDLIVFAPGYGMMVA